MSNTYSCPFGCGFQTNDVTDMGDHLDGSCDGSEPDHHDLEIEHPAYARLVELRDMVKNRDHDEKSGFDRGLIMAYNEAIRLLDMHGRV